MSKKDPVEEIFIKIGKIGKPHGTRGLVKLFFSPGGELDIKLCKTITCFLENNHKVDYNILSSQGSKENTIVQLDNIINLEDAKFLSGNEIFIHKNIIIKNKLFLPIAFLGAKTYIDNKSDNSFLGTISNIQKGSNYDFFLIQTPEKKEYTIPCTEHFILEHNIKKQYIILKKHEGFFDAI